MSEVVLDASALLALLHDEPGAAKVADVLAGGRICAVNLAEVVSHFIHLGMPAHEVDAMLHPLPVTVIAADDGLPGSRAVFAVSRRRPDYRLVTVSASRLRSAMACPRLLPISSGGRSPMRLARRSW